VVNGTRPSRRKLLQITSYPPPRAGWGVRVQFLKRQLEAEGHECVVLNTGRSRFDPSPEYETCVSGLDYMRKVWRFSRRGFIAHIHVNGESPKAFVLTLVAQVLNLAAGKRSYLTFHAGVDQVYFPRPKSPALLPMYWLMFAIPRRIVCNSAAVKAKILEYGVADEKVVPIPAFSRQYLQFTRVGLGDAVETFYARFPVVLFTYIRIREGFYLDTLLEGFAELVRHRGDVGLLLLGVSGDIDKTLWADVERRLGHDGLATRVCVVDDMDHDAFLTALTRSAIYVRTPTTDGVASSVLESLALGVPVVASENGTRPPGVVTYSAADPRDMVAAIEGVLARRTEIVATMPSPDIRDTLADEIAVLTT
jgi:glycosyltransferase involved in cell wall biosynthesis